MLHVILQILSVIGIILLCILGIIILLFLLVTLCPVKYYIHGEKQDKEMDCKIKITYLFHLITIRYDYPKPAEPIIKIAGIRFSGKKVKQPKQSKSESNKTNTNGTNANDINTNEKKSVEKTEVQLENNECEDKKAEENITKDLNNETTSEIKQDRTIDLKEESTNTKHTQSKWEKLCYTIKQFYGKMKHTIQDIYYYKEVLTNPANQALYSRLKQRLLVILKKIKPKYLKAYIIFGTGSPDTTGYACGLYGVLIPIFGKQINLVPDFENVIFNGDITAKGSIKLMTILIQAINVYFDKQLWIFIKQLKRED